MPKKKYITSWLQAAMAPLGDNKKVKVQVGTTTEKVKKGIFSKEYEDVEVPVYEEKIEWVPNGDFSQFEVSLKDMASRLEDELNSMNDQGYDVISVMPVTVGNRGWESYGSCAGSAPTAVSWGYSLTRGVVIAGKLRD